jgi:hypothetical protein
MLDGDNIPVSDAVQLTRIEGKIDRLNDRTGRVEGDLTNVQSRLNGHSERLTAVEKQDTLADGKRQGTEQVVKVLWAILGVMLTGGIATIATVVAALLGAFNGVGG